MNVFDLVAKISLDSSDYEKGLDDASEKTSSFGQKVGKVAGTVGKVAVGAVGVGAAAVTGLVKSSVSAYSEYEQLVGGIDTLYEDLSDDIMKYADNAYKTAGMSANEYMDTAISFAASLNNSLQESDGNIARSADLTNQIITDMSDNVNKMGTSMESIQNAYKGFSRGNFTMLDNLSLGFSGTKEGMEELLKKAEEISGIKYDISSFADITEAIHVVQTEMGITGTTAKEADKTIQGSVNSMKGAWQNLVTGLGDSNADMDTLIGNFVDSLMTVGENIIPVIEKALNGVATLIDKLLPKLLEKLPSLVESILPKLLNASINVVTTIFNQLPNLISSQLPIILQALMDIINTLIPEIPGMIDTLLKAFIDAIGQIAEMIPELIPKIIDLMLGIVDVLLDNIDLIIDAAIKIALGLADGLVEAIPKIVQKIPEIIVKIVEALIKETPAILEGGLRLFAALGEALISAIGEIIMMVPELIDQLLSLFTELAPDIAEFFSDAWELIKGIWEIATEWFSGVWQGIVGVFSGVGEWFSGIFQGAWDGIQNIWSAVTEFFSGIWSGITGIFSGVASWFSGIFSSAYSAVTGIWDSITGFFSGVWNTIVGIFKDAGVAVGDAISGAVKGAVNAVLSGATGIINGFISAINLAISVINAIPGVKISKLQKLSAPALEEGIGLAQKGKQYLLEGKGNEAVVPIDKDLKWTNKVAGDMLMALSRQGLALGGQSGDIIIPVYIGNDRIQELVIKANKINDYRSGGVA